MTVPIRFIGAGGAHDIHLGNSAALLTRADKTFLIDCGFTVYPRLIQHGLIERIDAVLITHLHDDHIGSLSALLYHRHFLSKLPPLPVLVGTPELFAKLYTYLHFLMGEVERFAELKYAGDYAPYIKAIPTDHLHVPHMPGSAYVVSLGDMYVLYSGDIAQPVPVLQDPDWVKAHQPLVVFHDIAFQRTPTHCYYEALYPFMGQMTIWGYHCDPAAAPSDLRIPLVHKTFSL